jgi:hypothetical protein
MQDVRLYFKQSAIRDDGEFLCLTDMWRAAGSDKSKRPAKWLETEAAREFADYLRNDIRHTDIIRSERGSAGQRGGGATWAHWQLGLAYAKYLSPEFHAWCNDVVRAVMQGRPPQPSQQIDVAALTQSILATAIPLIMQTVDARIDAKVQGVSLGVIRPWEHGALVRRINAAADAVHAIGARPSRRSARSYVEMRVRTSCGWVGTGSKMNRMPAAMLPYAERELSAIEREYERSSGRQLELVASKRK